VHRFTEMLVMSFQFLEPLQMVDNSIKNGDSRLDPPVSIKKLGIDLLKTSAKPEKCFYQIIVPSGIC
jgi:hypothetical protein